MKELKEFKVGEVREIDGKKIICVEDKVDACCDKCVFLEGLYCEAPEEIECRTTIYFEEIKEDEK